MLFSSSRISSSLISSKTKLSSSQLIKRSFGSSNNGRSKVEGPAIPIIDLKEDLNSISTKLSTACKNVGFFYLTNHGLKEELMDQVFTETKRFFDLEEKLKRTCLANKHNRGWGPMKEEKSDPNQTEGDFKEGYYIGRELSANQEQNPFSGPNVWPSESLLPGWRKTMMEYHSQMQTLGFNVVRYLALSLDLPKNYFDKYFDKPMAILRLLHYAPSISVPTEGKFGCGAHSDYGMITLLATDSVPGLQIYYNDKWIDVPPKKYAFVINLGDMLARWSNDTYKSTIHRVINTTGKHRYSIPYFYEPNYDTVVECLPSCCNDTPAKYPPVISGEYLLNKYKDTHELFDAHNKKK